MKIPSPEEMMRLLAVVSRLPLKQARTLTQELNQSYKQCVRNYTTLQNVIRRIENAAPEGEPKGSQNSRLPQR